MNPELLTRLTDRIRGAGMFFGILAACVLWMPVISDLREPKSLVLGCLVLAGAGAMTLSRSFLVGTLMLYVAVHTYIVTPTMTVTFPLMVMALLGVVYAVVVRSWPRWHVSKGRIYDAICMVALLNVAAMIPQAFQLYVIPALPIGTVFDRSFGLTGNPNEVSIVLAVCLPFFFRRGWAWCIPAVVAGLIMARTTNGAVAACVVTFIYLVTRSRDWYAAGSIAVTILAAFCLFVAVFDNFDLKGQLGGRGLVYKRTAQLATVAPLGWGLRNFEFIMPLMTYSVHMNEISRTVAYAQLPRKDLLDGSLVTVTGTQDTSKMRAFLDEKENGTTAAFLQAHNDWLEALFVFGFPGFALLLIAAWSVLRKGFKIADRLPVLGLIASMLCALFFFAWQLVPVAVLTTVILAVIVGENNKEASHA